MKFNWLFLFSSTILINYGHSEDGLKDGDYRKTDGNDNIQEEISDRLSTIKISDRPTSSNKIFDDNIYYRINWLKDELGDVPSLSSPDDNEVQLKQTTKSQDPKVILEHGLAINNIC